MIRTTRADTANPGSAIGSLKLCNPPSVSSAVSSAEQSTSSVSPLESGRFR